MFKVSDRSYKTIRDAILFCQENESPDVNSRGTFFAPLPPITQLEKEHEWMESGKKSPNAWRLEDDGLHILVKKNK